METPAMVKPNQNSGIHSYLHVKLMAVITTTLVTSNCFKNVKNYPQNIMPLQISR